VLVRSPSDWDSGDRRSSHKFQCDRPSITFPELSLDAIALPIGMGCRRRGDRSFVSVIQFLDGAG